MLTGTQMKTQQCLILPMKWGVICCDSNRRFGLLDSASLNRVLMKKTILPLLPCKSLQELGQFWGCSGNSITVIRIIIRGALMQGCAMITCYTVLDVLISVPSTENQRPAIYAEKHLKHLCANCCVTLHNNRTNIVDF